MLTAEAFHEVRERGASEAVLGQRVLISYTVYQNICVHLLQI